MLESNLAIRAVSTFRDDLMRINRRIGRHELSEVGLKESNGPIWRGLGHLYRRDWFARLWTWQEVVLAKGERQGKI